MLEVKDIINSLGIDIKGLYFDKANNSWLISTTKKSEVDNFINKIMNRYLMGP